MDFTEEFDLGHLVLQERKRRCCKKVKDLLTEFYKTHKDRGSVASSYSYECKECTKKRIKLRRKNRPRPLPPYLADYPDW